VDETIPLDQVLKDWRGTVVTEIGSRANGERVSLLDIYNAKFDPDFGPDAGWTPALRHHAPLPAVVVPLLTTFLAGAGRLPA
jgi:pectate lyase